MIQAINRRRQQEGFTLVELLIVIVILGILAAIVVFAVGGITDTGQKSACKSDYKSIETAEEAYFAQGSPSAYAAMPSGDTSSPLIPKYLHEPSAYYNVVVASGNYTIAADTTAAASAGHIATSNACATFGIPPS